MGLIDLKTDLKSLKYGLDRRGGGSSKEPFITKSIPEGETPGASQDFLLRQGAIVSSVNDTSRLFQLFTTTRGLSFIANQNLLSRGSVKTEATLGPAYAGGTVNQGVYLPTSTLAQTVAGFTGTHLNLLGLDPTSPIAGVVEGGLFPGGGLIRYEQAAFDFNQNGLNRLVKLKEDKIDLDPNSTELLSYGGGPGSVLGIGKTIIKRTSNTTGINPYGNPDVGYKSLPEIRINNSLNSLNLNNLLGASTEYKINNPDFNTGINEEGSYTGLTDNPKSTNPGLVTLKTAYKKPDGSDLTYTTKGENGQAVKEYKANPNFTRYRYGNLDNEGNYNNDKFNRKNSKTLNTSTDLTGEAIGSKQLFKFYLNFIDPDNPGGSNYLYWQAYVDNFNDQIGAEYDSYNYVGRGYPLYKYKGFTRKIGLDFTIVATTPDEIVPIYKKLNTLIQRMAPDYSNQGYLRGSFVKLTFGDYLNSVPGIIGGFSLTPIYDAGFDIGGVGENTSGKQLPKAIKVGGFDFTPIADNNSRVINNRSTFIST